MAKGKTSQSHALAGPETFQNEQSSFASKPGRRFDKIHELFWLFYRRCGCLGALFVVFCLGRGMRDLDDLFETEIGGNITFDDSILKVSDTWVTMVDNTFAENFFKRLRRLKIPVQEPTYPSACTRCRDLGILSPNFKCRFKTSDFEQSRNSCGLCGLLYRHCSPCANDEEEFELIREKSALRVVGKEPLELRLCTGATSQEPLKNVQVGFPQLPDRDSAAYFELLREWIRVCNEQHDGCRSKSRPYIPTRVIDVGTKAAPLLRLHCTRWRDRWRPYIALSHRWGDIPNDQRLQTLRTNYQDFFQAIEFKELHKSFQDAVTVTRELGVRFLWIDSLCIIQTDDADWKKESSRMQEVFGSAYCTIAATSAQNSNVGFLGQRVARPCTKISDDPGVSIYVSEGIDNFQSDVERGLLNQRGWVLQERALSRRTIHFTDTQAYWECGDGVHCETLIKLKSDRASFLGDPQFPQSLLDDHGERRLRLLEFLFSHYCERALTQNTDRSVAISGLEKRLAMTFNMKVRYGIYEGYLHRNLLWQRCDQPLERLTPPAGWRVPSWSWMAYDGKITYVNVTLGEGYWSTAVGFYVSKTVDFALQAPVRKFVCCKLRPEGRRGAKLAILDEEDPNDETGTGSGERDEMREWVAYDGDHAYNIHSVSCVVLGKEKKEYDFSPPPDGPPWYVLVVGQASAECESIGDLYMRLGVASVRQRHISFGQEMRFGLII